MTKAEAERVASYLTAAHKPKRQPKLESKQPVANESSATGPVLAGSPPRVGATCPKCGTRKLLRKSVTRKDGTETDFLACAGHPKDCSQIFALVTKALEIPLPEAAPAPEPAVPTQTKQPRRQQGNKYCYKCNIDIPQNVASYCFDRPNSFGGRAYCRRCQGEILAKKLDHDS